MANLGIPGWGLQTYQDNAKKEDFAMKKLVKKKKTKKSKGGKK